MRVSELDDFAIEQNHSPNVGGAMSAHHGVVLHIAEGYYRGTIAWQLNPDQRYSDGTQVTTSSTWIVGEQRGQWAQMVDSDTVAWAQRGGSHRWMSIELEGFAPHQLTDWQLEACAQLLAWAHRHHGVPLQVADHPGQRGLGHHSMDREWLGEQWGHEACPGQPVIDAKRKIVDAARGIVGGGGGSGGGGSTRPAPGPKMAFPLPAGYYFGPKEWGDRSVSGFYGRRFRGRRDREWLQEFVDQLRRRGWNARRGGTYLSHHGSDGRYGDEHAELIRAFQADQGLTVDGLLGPDTWAAAYRNAVT